MLLDGRERHVVASREFAHRGVAFHDACHDVAPRGVGQGAEEGVEVAARGLQMYNHMVVY